jgi:uncharacterized membrane protein (TIGR02234 family)
VTESETETGPPTSTSRRGYAAALALLAVGGALMLLAYGRVWVTATVGEAGLPSLSVELTGRDLQPESTATALVALAGIAALIATRRVGRMVTGTVLLVLGLVSAARAVQFAVSDASSTTSDGTVGRLVAERTGVGSTGLVATHSAWWAVALVAALLVSLAGVVVVLRSRAWPVLGGRYEPAGAPERTSTERRPESAWDQLDRGLDPTADPNPATTPDTAPDPTLRGGAEA